MKIISWILYFLHISFRLHHWEIYKMINFMLISANTCTLDKYTYERFVHMKTYHKVSFVQILSTRLFPNQFQLQYETSEDEWDDLSFSPSPPPLRTCRYIDISSHRTSEFPVEIVRVEGRRRLFLSGKLLDAMTI